MFHDPFVISEETGRKLLEWLNSGKSFTEQAKESNPEPMTKAQSNALMAYLTKKHGDDRAAYLAELSDFFGRPISSSRELTKDDVSEFLDVVNSGREAV